MQLTSDFVSKTTDICAMGLVSLASLTITFLWAWGKQGSRCIPDRESSSSWSWEQVVAVGFPYFIFPFAVGLTGLAKVAETERDVLSFVAACSILEFMTSIVLGAEMAYCMSDFPLVSVVLWTLLLIIFLVVIWASVFSYPKVTFY